MKTLALRRPATCQTCATHLSVGTTAGWDAAARTVTCLPCLGSTPATTVTSTAGGSAQREYDRRSQRREHRIRQDHPRIGGLLLMLTDEPASTRVWAQGAAGERAVAAALDGLAGPGLAVLHDRALRLPDGRPSKANVDHLVVAPSGVWVVDAKTHSGSLEVRSRGLLGLGEQELWIGGRDRSSLVAGLVTQMHAVRAVIPDVELPVRGAPCFVGTELPWFGSSSISGVPLVGRKGSSSSCGPTDLRHRTPSRSCATASRPPSRPPGRRPLDGGALPTSATSRSASEHGPGCG